MTLESDFQQQFVVKLRALFSGCIILKNDPTYIQGIPDLIILFNGRWAALEVKRSIKAKKQPNQDYWVETMGRMSYAAFVYPENEQEVLDAIQQALRS